MEHPDLGHGIGGRRIARAERRDARGVDDRRPLAPLHVRRRITDPHRDRFQNQIHRAVPAFGGDLVDRGAVAARGGVVEDDIDTAGFRGGGVHQRLDIRRPGHIAADKINLAVRLFGERAAARFVDVGGKDVRTFACQF